MGGPARWQGCVVIWTGGREAVGGRRRTELLRNRLHREDLRAAPAKLKSQDPLTGDVAAVNFRRHEFPTVGCLQGQFGKISARPGVFECRCCHAPRGGNTDFNSHSHLALNGFSRTSGHIRQDLVKDFAWRARGGRGLGSGLGPHGLRHGTRTSRFFVAGCAAGLLDLRRYRSQRRS